MVLASPDGEHMLPVSGLAIVEPTSVRSRATWPYEFLSRFHHFASDFETDTPPCQSEGIQRCIDYTRYIRYIYITQGPFR